jgi:hypothetical protein
VLEEQVTSLGNAINQYIETNTEITWETFYDRACSRSRNEVTSEGR